MSPGNILPRSICTLKLVNLVDLGWAMRRLLTLHNRILLAAQQKPGKAVEPWLPQKNWLQMNQVLMQTRVLETMPRCHICLFNSPCFFKSGTEAVKRWGSDPPASACIKHLTLYREAVLCFFKPDLSIMVGNLLGSNLVSGLHMMR